MNLSINEIIGTKYSQEDQLMCDPHVAQITGVEIIDEEGWSSVYIVGDPYKDSEIVDMFIHPESDCVWMITKCNGIYFEMTFDDMARYKVIEEDNSTPKYIKDSTELSGGHLW